MDANNHDDRDLNVSGVTKAGLGIVAAVIGSAFLMWFLFDRFALREAGRAPQPEPMVAANPQKLPPEPRLQPAPVADLATFRAEEDKVLNRYAVIDKANGIVRIPVERALELVAKEGLPARKQERGR